MPRRGPRQSESIGEYLFCRRTVVSGEVLLQPSNLLIPHLLLEEVPFRSGQRKWEDVDWLLRAGRREGTGLEFIPEVLSIWHCENGRRETMSGTPDWKYLFDWAMENRDLFTEETYSGVLLTNIAQEAARQGDFRAALHLLREAVTRGAPNVVQFGWFFLGFLPGLFCRWIYTKGLGAH
jgi:hypothetical protein